MNAYRFAHQAPTHSASAYPAAAHQTSARPCFSHASCILLAFAILLAFSLCFAAPFASATEPSKGTPSESTPTIEEPSAEGTPTDEALAEPEAIEPVSYEPCPLPEGTYLIQTTLGANSVVDINGGSLSAGANAQLWEYNATAAQKFRLIVAGNGSCALVNDGSGLALTVVPNRSNNIVQSSLENGVPSADQQWLLHEKGSGSYTIESVALPGYVLDVAAANKANGTNIQAYEANGTAAQTFRLINIVPSISTGTAVTEGLYRIQSALGTNLSLDISGASLIDGGRAQIYSSNGTLAQLFQIEAAPDETTHQPFYRIRAVHSGKYLEVAGNSPFPCASIQQYGSTGKANQLWAFVPTEGGYSLINKANGYALDVKGAQAASETPLQTYAPNKTAAQTWTLEEVTQVVPNGVYQIRANLGTHRVVDINGASGAPSANVQLWSANNTLAQRFYISSQGNNVYTIEALCSGLLLTRDGANVIQAQRDAQENGQLWQIAAAQGGGLAFLSADDPALALDVSGANDADGTNIGVYAINGTRAQSFLVDKRAAFPDGYYTITCVAGGRVLDVSAGSLNDGANVQVYESNGTGAQKWQITEQSDGTFVILNARSGKALDVKGANASSGTNVQQYLPNNTKAQRWMIDYLGSQRYRIASALGDLVLHVDGEGTSNGCNVAISTPTGAECEQFTFAPTTYRLSEAELCQLIDTVSGSTAVTTFGNALPLSDAHLSALNSATNRIRSAGYNVGYVVIDADTGHGFSCNPYGVNYVASSIKGPYVASVCKFDPWSIRPYKLTMAQTIEYSSNEGYLSLRSRFGSWPMEQLMNEVGVHSFSPSVNYCYLTAHDLAKLWVGCYNYFSSDEMNAAWCKSLYTHSYHSSIYYQLSGYGTTTYSKPGWYPNERGLGAMNDAGIVERDGHTYIVAILTSAYERFDLMDPLVRAIDAASYDLR